MLRTASLAGLLPLVLIAAACGATGDGGGPSSFADPTLPVGAPRDPNAQFPSVDAGAPAVETACVVTTAETEITPVHLVVMFDRSGSMGDPDEDPSFDPAKRWVPVTRAMKAFFADARGATMRAQLTYFPRDDGSCRSDDFETADVPTTALPSASFATALDATRPRGDTPTRAAAAGALAQARSVAAAHPDRTVAVVLVTDGEPYGCGVTERRSDEEATAVAAMVGLTRGSIPAYVVGVGPSVGNVDALAAAGGTNALHVVVAEPERTSDAFLDALVAIRGAVARCDFEVPPAPDRRTLDPNKVNVEVVGADAARVTLPHRQDCAGGVGWRWDDPVRPTRVLLCASTCEAVKVESGGKVELAFGCVDRPDAIH